MTESAGPVPFRRTPLAPGSIREIRVNRRRSRLASYAIAAALTLIAFGLTVLLEQWLTRTVFLLFWPAVIASAWFGGFGPAMMSAVMSVGAVDYYLIPPRGILKEAQTTDIATLLGFLTAAALASWAVSQFEKAKAEADEAASANATLARQLDEQGVELAQQLEEAQAMQEELEASTEELTERSAEAVAAERFSRGVLESISDPFVVHDSDWRFRYINEAAARAFDARPNSSQKSLIGKIVWEEWPEILGTPVEREMRRAVADQVPVTFEAFDPPTGTWAQMFCYPLPDGGLGTQWKDITARKQAEESAQYLAQASEVLASSLDYETTLKDLARLIVPHFADWCAVSMLDDDDSTRQLAVAHVDPSKVEFARELNRRYPPNPSATTGVPNVIRTGQPEIYPEIPDELLVAGAIDDEHLRISRELGLRSAMVVPLSTADRTFGAITIVSAESGRRYSQKDLAFAMELARRAALAVDNALHHRAELEARRVAESANAAKTQFLAVMSHELRTPLNAIGGYAELLLMGLRGSLTPEQQADLERIQRNQRNLLSLINDILNYAKLDAGHVEFSMKNVPLHTLLLELEPLVAPQLGARNLTYKFGVCDESLIAWADPEKLRQVVLNLLSNAIKFTEPGGLISVDCGSLGDHLQVTVCDTGLGIPASKLNSIFEPFVQLERMLSSSHEGTGLGLAISRDLARGMGGDLHAESEVGKGSTFVITLQKGQV